MRHAARRRSLPLAIALVCEAGWGQSPDAQQPEALPEPIRIEVTGSRIARVEGETALPVQVIGRDEILRGNWTTAAELMSYVSANITPMNNALSVGNNLNPGLSSANLRGMGDFNTLVLLNGRRLSNYAFVSGTVDLTAIPLAAIERVEILKDGASSIYGSDAVAGVVNFITRKDFAGAEITGQAGVTEHGGGDHYQATVTVGWGDLTKDRFNAFVTLDWQKDGALGASQRPFASTGYRPDEGINMLTRPTFPANIRKPDGTFVNPARASGCAPPDALQVGNTPACWYDVPAQADLLPDQELWNGIGRATWEWTPGQQLFAEYVFSRNDLELRTAPTALNRNQTFGVPVRYPAGGPYYPTEFAAANGLSGPLEVNMRTSPLGPRVTTVTTEARRFVLGGQGSVAGWAYDAAYTHSENTAENAFSSGYLSTPGLLAVMASGLINPFGESGAAGLELLRSAQVGGTVRDAKGTIDQLDLNVSRDVLGLSGGPLAVALGGEWRRERLTDNPSALLDSGDVVGIGIEIDPQQASRTVSAVFAEVNVPIVRTLEVGASVRHDHYSDFGGTTNPKVAIRWQPAPSLLMRGTWGTGFRAPSLPDLYTPRSYAFISNFKDPIRCPVTDVPADCGQGEYVYVYGGNRELQPETSTQYSAGVIWEPVPGVSLGLEWWQISKENLIVWFTPAEVFARYDALAPGHVIRGPVDHAYPGLPGPIEAIVGTKENMGGLTTSGIDVTLNARLNTAAAGTFGFSLTGTYIDRFSVDDTGTGSFDVAGLWALGPVPRWRHYAAINWQRGSWGATLAQLYQGGYVDANPNPTVAPRDVSSYSLWNVQGTYAGFRNWSIAGGIRNLFDTDPPFSNQGATVQVGYDPTYGDPRGRTFYLRLTYAFR